VEDSLMEAGGVAEVKVVGVFAQVEGFHHRCTKVGF